MNMVRPMGTRFARSADWSATRLTSLFFFVLTVLAAIQRVERATTSLCWRPVGTMVYSLVSATLFYLFANPTFGRPAYFSRKPAKSGSGSRVPTRVLIRSYFWKKSYSEYPVFLGARIWFIFVYCYIRCTVVLKVP
jgi:hypothetical protein